MKADKLLEKSLGFFLCLSMLFQAPVFATIPLEVTVQKNQPVQSPSDVKESASVPVVVPQENTTDFIGENTPLQVVSEDSMQDLPEGYSQLPNERFGTKFDLRGATLDVLVFDRLTGETTQVIETSTQRYSAAVVDVSPFNNDTVIIRVDGEENSYVIERSLSNPAVFIRIDGEYVSHSYNENGEISIVTRLSADAQGIEDPAPAKPSAFVLADPSSKLHTVGMNPETKEVFVPGITGYPHSTMENEEFVATFVWSRKDMLFYTSGMTEEESHGFPVELQSRIVETRDPNGNIIRFEREYDVSEDAYFTYGTYTFGDVVMDKLFNFGRIQQVVRPDGTILDYSYRTNSRTGDVYMTVLDKASGIMEVYLNGKTLLSRTGPDSLNVRYVYDDQGVLIQAVVSQDKEKEEIVVDYQKISLVKNVLAAQSAFMKAVQPGRDAILTLERPSFNADSIRELFNSSKMTNEKILKLIDDWTYVTRVLSALMVASGENGQEGVAFKNYPELIEIPVIMLDPETASVEELDKVLKTVGDPDIYFARLLRLWRISSRAALQKLKELYAQASAASVLN